MVSTQSPSASELFSCKTTAPVASIASASSSGVQALYLEGDFVQLLDQNALPETKVYLPIGTVEEMADAIRVMKVRGAPAIGIAAAYGLVLDAQNVSRDEVSTSNLIQRLRKSSDLLASTRPTAVNLAWALNEMSQVLDQAEKSQNSVGELVIQLRDAALKIHQDDIAACKEIGRLGATLFPQKEGGLGVLTHCNAGALATGGYGTALGVIRSVFERDSKIRVYADETRPRFQGARLTTWELVEDGIPVTLIADNMSAVLMRDGLIDRIVVGADRITANGDVANKIGTYGVAVLANAHNIPFYVAAPLSTIDLSLEHGKDIPIEERDASEVWNINGAPICAKGTQFFNPAFDVTPARLVKAIITEKGIVEGPNYNAGLAALFK